MTVQGLSYCGCKVREVTGGLLKGKRGLGMMTELG